MGACCSSREPTTLTTNPAVKSSAKPADGVDTPSTHGHTKEEKLKLNFKAKRANIFTEGIDQEMRSTYVAKKVKKEPAQTKMIIASLSKNYVFESMDHSDLSDIADVMNIIPIRKGEDVIVQGDQRADYLYLIESGSFHIIKNGSILGTLGTGDCFGELALLYNAPRQATIRCATPGSLFSLDRANFRLTIAQKQSNEAVTIKQALSKVTILQDLTSEQLEKLVDAVHLVQFKAGEVIVEKGQEGSIFYMIKDGTLSVTNMGTAFAENLIGPGDYFGERALLTGEPRAATVTGVSDGHLLTIDKESFGSFLGPLRELLEHNFNLRVLDSVKVFEKLTKAEKARVAKSFEEQIFQKDVTIIKEGEKGSKFYIIKEGKARVSTLEKGDITVLSKGQYFGEMAILNDEPRTATVTAVETCSCFVLDRTVFNRLLGSLNHILEREVTQRMDALRTGPEGTGAQQLSLKFTDLQHLSILGSGTFGKVTLVQDKNTKQVYALKAMLKSEIVLHKQQLNVISEKNVMLACQNPFILRLYQTFKDPKRLYMLLEFVQGGELFSVLHTPQSDGVPDHQAKFYAAGVLIALSFLHSREIAYRDLKPENCLVDKFGYPKLVDFGFAKVIQGKSFTLCGTPEYLAPELVLGRGHNKAVDYWAYGILLYEMQAGYSPFSDPNGMDQMVICKNIVSGRLMFPKTFNPQCKELVKKLLSREIQSRLGNLRGGPEEIKAQEWFRGFDMESYFNKQMPAPWVPNVSSATDTSNFDPYGVEDHVDDGYIDNGVWDRDF